MEKDEKADLGLVQIIANVSEHDAVFDNQYGGVKYEFVIFWGLSKDGCVNGYIYTDDKGICNAEDCEFFLKYQRRP